MAEGGYDVKLVEEPNVPLKTECLICQLTLRDPYETECCNTFVCKICVEEYKRRKIDCFLCRKYLKYRKAPAQKRVINQLIVYCTHRDQGCRWKGELGELDRHLNFYPYVKRIDTGCDFTEVECPICHENFKRPDYSLHKIDQCPNEEIPCVYHTKGCQWRGERRTLEEHLCSKEVLKGCGYKCKGYVSIKCEFGCQNEFFRKDIDEHMSKNVYQHLRQVRDHIQEDVRNSKNELNATIQQQQQRIKQLEEQRIKQLEEQRIKQLEEQRIKQLEEQRNKKYSLSTAFQVIFVVVVAVTIAVYYQSLAVPSLSVAEIDNLVQQIKPSKKPVFTLKDLTSTRKPVKDIFFSNSGQSVQQLPYDFYFHDYDKYLATDIMQFSKIVVPFEEVHSDSCSFHFFAALSTRNEVPTLEMCFRASSSVPAVSYIQLVNQKAMVQHHVDNIGVGCNTNLIHNVHVEPQFIDIVNNQLHIRILSIELDGNKNPPYLFSLCHYHTYFNSTSPNKVWRSNPFYFSPGGFKFTLEVYPNGIESGLGTHLSLVIVTDEDNMKPFNGDITVFFRLSNNDLNIELIVEFNGENKLTIPKVLSHNGVQELAVDYDCILLGISSINVN